MTAAQKPEPGTAVQMVENAAVGNLPPAVQQQLELRKLQNQIAGKLAETNWGKGLDLAMRRAVADWGRQYRVDVTTEIHVLGGNVYLNAAFYLRQLAEMIRDGLVEYAFADHVEHDDRLAQMGAEGEGETTRRLRERLMHGIPDKAASAVVFRVKLRAMAKEITGAKWCGGGTRKSDPVGDQFPVETSESRAARRALRLITSYVPKTRADEIELIESSAEDISERVVDANRTFRESEAQINRPPAPMALPAAGDPYGPVATVPAPAKEPAVVSPSPTSPDVAKQEMAKAPSFAELTASINRLIKHERVSEELRGELMVAAANAQTETQLGAIIARLEDVIAGDGELGL